MLYVSMFRNCPVKSNVVAHLKLCLPAYKTNFNRHFSMCGTTR